MFIYMYEYSFDLCSDIRPLPILPILPSYVCLINYPVLVRLITTVRLKLWFRRSGRDEFVDRFRRDQPTIFRRATLSNHRSRITQIVESAQQILRQNETSRFVSLYYSFIIFIFKLLYIFLLDFIIFSCYRFEKNVEVPVCQWLEMKCHLSGSVINSLRNKSNFTQEFRKDYHSCAFQVFSIFIEFFKFHIISFVISIRNKKYKKYIFKVYILEKQ